MPRITHTVVVDPVRPEWFEHLVDLAHEEVEAYLGHDEFPLVEGRPLAPGARYATPDGTAEFTVAAWHPGVRTAGTYAARAEDEAAGTLTLTGELSGGRSSRTLSMSLEAAPGPDGSRLRGLDGQLRADVAAWWAGVARGRPDTAGEPVVSGSATPFDGPVVAGPDAGAGSGRALVGAGEPAHARPRPRPAVLVSSHCRSRTGSTPARSTRSPARGTSGWRSRRP